MKAFLPRHPRVSPVIVGLVSLIGVRDIHRCRRRRGGAFIGEYVAVGLLLALGVQPAIGRSHSSQLTIGPMCSDPAVAVISWAYGEREWQRTPFVDRYPDHRWMA